MEKATATATAAVAVQVDVPCDEVREALQRIATQNATSADVARVRRYLQKTPEGRQTVSQALGSIGAYGALQSTGAHATDDGGTAAVMTQLYTAELEHLRQSLESEATTPAEHLLVQQVVESWSRLQYVQRKYDDALLRTSDPVQLSFWDRMLTRTQSRYLRTLESLSRVRRYEVQVVERRDANGSQQRSIAVRANG